jgi:hypothetical protein
MEASIPPAQPTQKEDGQIQLKPEIAESDANPNESKQTLGPNAEKIERYQLQMMFGDRREAVISARTYFYGSEPECDRHAEIFCKCIDAVHDATGGTGLAAIKVRDKVDKVEDQVYLLYIKLKIKVRDKVDKQGP